MQRVNQWLKIYYCLCLFFVFLMTDGICESVISFSKAPELNNAFNLYNKEIKSLNNVNLVDLLSNEQEKENILRVITNFFQVFEKVDKSITNNEYLQFNSNLINSSSELSFITSGKNISLLLLLQSKCLFYENKITESINKIYLAQRFIHQVTDNDLAISLLIRTHIESLCASLYLGIINNIRDVEVLKSEIEKQKEINSVTDIQNIFNYEFNLTLETIDELYIKNIIDQNNISSVESLDIARLKESFYLNFRKKFNILNDILISEIQFSDKINKINKFNEQINIVKTAEEMSDEKILYLEISNILISLSISPLIEVYYYYLIENILSDITKISIYLRIYSLEVGSYPQDISMLEQYFDKNFPFDPFSNTRYLYKLLPDNSYMLWSIGPDFDNNNCEYFYQRKSKTGDVFIKDISLFDLPPKN